MNPKLKQFATYNWTTAASATVILKVGAGTFHTAYAHPNENGEFMRTGDSSLCYQLLDSAATAGGALILTQFGTTFYDPRLPDYNMKPFEIDFEQGLTLKLNGGGTSCGSVTVVFS